MKMRTLLFIALLIAAAVYIPGDVKSEVKESTQNIIEYVVDSGWFDVLKPGSQTFRKLSPILAPAGTAKEGKKIEMVLPIWAENRL